MIDGIKGCVHLFFEKGKPIRLITHLSDFPSDGVVHLENGKIYTNEEFKKSHPQDIDEFEKEEGIILSDF